MTSLPPNPLGDRFNPFSARVQALLSDAVAGVMRFRALEPELWRVIRLAFDAAELSGLVQFHAILVTPSSIGTNRWQYPWAEVVLTATNTWTGLVGGRNSAQPGRTQARNLAEYLNTGTNAAHGVLLSDPPITFTVKAIPAGSPVLLTEVPLPTDPPTLGYWFSEVNALDPECA